MDDDFFDSSPDELNNNSKRIEIEEELSYTEPISESESYTEDPSPVNNSDKISLPEDVIFPSVIDTDSTTDENEVIADVDEEEIIYSSWEKTCSEEDNLQSKTGSSSTDNVSLNDFKSVAKREAFSKWYLDKYKEDVQNRKRINEKQKQDEQKGTEEKKKKEIEKQRRDERIKQELDDWLHKKDEERRLARLRLQDVILKKEQDKIKKREECNVAYEQWLKKKRPFSTKPAEAIAVTEHFRLVKYKDSTAILSPTIIVHKPWF